MIIVIDNYDSFTYNLVQYLRMLNAEVMVARNDEITITGVKSMAPSHIVISPGPGRPESAGICLDLIRHTSGLIPILGVCLGHQAIAESFGGVIVAAKRLMHGKTSSVSTKPCALFKGINSPFTAMRYHSLAVERESLPLCLEICAEAEDGEIMGIRHNIHPTVGVQFHPESVMTPKGKRILRNFLEMRI